MSLTSFFRRSTVKESAHKLYLKLVGQARRPEFYTGCGVPDTLDGRFDMIVLHAFLLMARLKRDRDEAAPLRQALFDVMFADMDRSLREMGVGDLGVGRRVKAMARGFYGRLAAYESSLADDDDTALAAALRRNLYGTVQPEIAHPARMADYVRREAASLARQDLEDLLAGQVTFGPPPAGT